MRPNRFPLPELPVLGTSRFAAEARQNVDSLSHSDAAILLTGSTGSGKEALARAIHAASSRQAKPFVKIDCALLSSSDFFDSQVFGHLPGQFAGLKTSSLGLIQAAHGGTVFLSGVESLELESQWKLLRTWQEGSVVPVGGAEGIPVDVRLMAATSIDLRLGVSVGLFRRDLYQTLAQNRFALPTLAERGEDIPALAEYVLSMIAKRKKLSTTPRFSQAAIDWLQAYHWPGNLTEFYRAVDGAVNASATTDEIDVDSIRRSMCKLHGNAVAKTRPQVQPLRRMRYTGFEALRTAQRPHCVSTTI
jgi:DNA-binding NtrC family response regulator